MSHAGTEDICENGTDAGNAGSGKSELLLIGGFDINSPDTHEADAARSNVIVHYYLSLNLSPRAAGTE